MSTEPGPAALSVNCQVEPDCTHLAGYILSGGVSGAMVYACAVHLAEAIDDALGEPILTSRQQHMARPIVTVQRA